MLTIHSCVSLLLGVLPVQAKAQCLRPLETGRWTAEWHASACGGEFFDILVDWSQD
jgi:hypothetical protein